MHQALESETEELSDTNIPPATFNLQVSALLLSKMVAAAACSKYIAALIIPGVAKHTAKCISLALGL